MANRSFRDGGGHVRFCNLCEGQLGRNDDTECLDCRTRQGDEQAAAASTQNPPAAPAMSTPVQDTFQAPQVPLGATQGAFQVPQTNFGQAAFMMPQYAFGWVPATLQTPQYVFGGVPSAYLAPQVAVGGFVRWGMGPSAQEIARQWQSQQDRLAREHRERQDRLDREHRETQYRLDQELSEIRERIEWAKADLEDRLGREDKARTGVRGETRRRSRSPRQEGRNEEYRQRSPRPVPAQAVQSPTAQPSTAQPHSTSPPPMDSTKLPSTAPKFDLRQGLRKSLEHFSQISEHMGRPRLQIAIKYRARHWLKQFDNLVDGHEVDLRGEIFEWLNIYIAHLRAKVQWSSRSTPQSESSSKCPPFDWEASYKIPTKPDSVEQALKFGLDVFRKRRSQLLRNPALDPGFFVPLNCILALLERAIDDIAITFGDEQLERLG